MKKKKMWHSRVSEKQDNGTLYSRCERKKFKAQQGSLSEKQDNGTASKCTRKNYGTAGVRAKKKIRAQQRKCVVKKNYGVAG